MKFLLASLNAKYIHSNLALYCLSSYCNKYEDNLELSEYTINNQVDAIIGDLYRKKPDVIGFSCYIWNINMIYQISSELKKILPNIKIWLGGPEVSYDAAKVLEGHKYIDGIMIGEGEQTLYELLGYYVDNQGELKDIKGISYQEEGHIFTTPCREPIDLSDVPFPYEDITKLENKIIYYETSRGCPYSCSYCLSSIDKKVRFRNTELVKKELQYFLDQKVPQVKFIDRTFNCKHDHTMAIWSYIHEHDNGITNFHFEISADILREEEIALLNQMRPGLVQLEVGVQSTNPETLKAIRRTMNLTKLMGNVDKVNQGHNVHQHLDLIAGLPYEDYNSFKKSFNDVYSYRPEQLQLGFLKVLKGSYMHEMSKEYGIVYKSLAPYEVLYTNWISYDELLKLKALEEMVEVYHNSGQFVYSVAFLEHAFATPFDLYEALAEYYEENGLFEQSHSRISRYYILLDFYHDVVKKDEEAFTQILVYDCYLREKMKSRPKFAVQEEEAYKALYRQLLQAGTELGKYLPGEKQYNHKQLLKISHIEEFSIDIKETAKTGTVVPAKQIILFDYENRSPLNHEARTVDITESLMTSVQP